MQQPTSPKIARAVAGLLFHLNADAGKEVEAVQRLHTVTLLERYKFCEGNEDFVFARDKDILLSAKH